MLLPYEEVTGRPVRCRFREADLVYVKEALGRRVLVRGILYSKRTGEAVGMKVESIEVFPDPRELPTVEMMRGILNNG